MPALFVDDSTHQALIGAGAAVTVEERVQGNTIRGDFLPHLYLVEGEVGMANVVNVFNTLEFEAGFVYVPSVVGDMVEVGSQQLKVLEVHVNTELVHGETPSRIITDAAVFSATSRVQTPVFSCEWVHIRSIPV